MLFAVMTVDTPLAPGAQPHVIPVVGVASAQRPGHRDRDLDYP